MRDQPKTETKPSETDRREQLTEDERQMLNRLYLDFMRRPFWDDKRPRQHV